MPILGDPGHLEMIQWLKGFRKNFIKATPDAIVLVTAHWEESNVTITSSEKPELFYDYYGFPPKAYDIKYPAPGNPELAKKIQSVLGESKITAKLNAKRGYDHGVFIPLKLMFPDADIPVIQMSILSSLDPEEHIKLGEALSSLRDENILIVGSGLSFHSFKYFFGDIKEANRVSVPFHEYLTDAVVKTTDPKERRNKLKQWAKAPYARECHPREEHLLPMLVIAGAGLNDPCDEIFDGSVMNIRTSGFLFGTA